VFTCECRPFSCFLITRTGASGFGSFVRTSALRKPTVSTKVWWPKLLSKCKAFARSLMNFEQQVVLTIQEREAENKDLPSYYEKFMRHLINQMEWREFRPWSYYRHHWSIIYVSLRARADGLRLCACKNPLTMSTFTLVCYVVFGVATKVKLFLFPSRKYWYIYQILSAHMQEASLLDTRPS
jgi:hypothetical protein